MTVFAKNTTYGLETVIKEFQEYLNTELTTIWSGDIYVYGLIYRTEKDGLIKPEAYTGSGINRKEYSPVFINDKIACTVGFIVQERGVIPYKSASTDIVFTIKIDKIYSTTTRDSELALLQVEKIINAFGSIEKTLDLKETIPVVFAGFSNDAIKYRDMHPWYVFSFNVDIPYSDDSC